MALTDKYLDYCSRLFDSSVKFEQAKKKCRQKGLTAKELKEFQQEREKVEREFLNLCQCIKDEYYSTNPKTLEVSGLLEFMYVILNGHYNHS